MEGDADSLKHQQWNADCRLIHVATAQVKFMDESV